MAYPSRFGFRLFSCSYVVIIVVCPVTTMIGLNIAVFMGSVREGRVADRVTKFVVAKLKERNHLVTVVDPKELNLPLIDKAYSSYPEGTAPQALKQVAEIIRHADAFLVVSAEYNNSISPALTNMLDHFSPSSYKYRPSAIVCYSIGPYGGVRAAMQLRAFLAELQTPSDSTTFPGSFCP